MAENIFKEKIMEKYTKVAVHALIRKGDKCLLTRRSKNDDYRPGYWDVPGGTIEFGEDIIKALKRELKEEIGINVKIGKPIFVYNYLSGEYRHQFMIVYRCDFLSGDIKLSKDHDEYRWVSVEEMGKLKLIKFLRALYKNCLTLDLEAKI